MAIYTRLGAPVQIVEAEVRTRWYFRKRGVAHVLSRKPTERQLKGAKGVEEFNIWWIKAMQIGAYPDGSGFDGTCKFLQAEEDPTKRGFLDETFFRADDGIREIHAACEKARVRDAA